MSLTAGAAPPHPLLSRGVDDTGSDGIDFGDLPEIFDAVVREAQNGDERADDELTLRRDYTGEACQHRRALVNGSRRTLTCRACGAQLDPFDFLWRLSRDPEGYVHTRKDAERRAVEARARLDELLRSERNTRQRIQRLNNKQPDDDDGA